MATALDRVLTKASFEVERGVPIPYGAGGSGRPPIYPFRQMSVGDSFFVPCERESRETIRRRLSAAKRNYRPKSFITANEDNGVRVWRVK